MSSAALGTDPLQWQGSGDPSLPLTKLFAKKLVLLRKKALQKYCRPDPFYFLSRCFALLINDLTAEKRTCGIFSKLGKSLCGDGGGTLLRTPPLRTLPPAIKQLHIHLWGTGISSVDQNE